MPIRIAVALLTLIFSNVTFAGEEPRTYAEAKTIWQQNQNSAEYQDYVAAFTQFNNHFRLDEKGGCYTLAPGPVSLMLIITHPDNGEFAVIERVFADVNTAKAQCFKGTYTGVRTKIPPFYPFVLQMDMR
jgi:hypothetical protein